MKSYVAAACAVALACVLPLPAHALETPIHITPDVPFRDGVGDADVRLECRFGQQVSQSIARHSDGKVVVDADGGLSEGGRRLDVVVTKVHAAGGGAVSGPKWGRIYGELKEDGRVVGNFTFKRSTNRPFTFRACTTLEKVADALGGDVANWLQQPTLDPNLDVEVASN